MNNHVENDSSLISRGLRELTELDRTKVPEKTEEPSATALFDLYEKVIEARPGSRDAEIFEKIREWTFSDFSLPAHEFAGVSKGEMDSWQKRHRINLSAGQIRPDPIDLQRGYAWGQIRMAAGVNRLHSNLGPPSADELGLAISTANGQP